MAADSCWARKALILREILYCCGSDELVVVEILDVRFSGAQRVLAA